VLAAFDHQDLNAAMAAVSTTENLALDIRGRLLESWSSAFRGEWPRLDGVRLGETPRNVIEIKETP